MLAVDNLGKRFGKQTLFDGATFNIGTRDRIGVIGPNGAGKSTFFKMLLGQEGCDSGQIHQPKGYTMACLKQEWVPHEGDTVVEATLREHLRWFGVRQELRQLEARMGNSQDDRDLNRYGELTNEFYALGGDTLTQEARALLTGLGFQADELDRQAHTFSGGWRMRCHLAGLLLQQADLLLLDEPTNHLDIASVEWLEEFLLEYERAYMVISHDRRLIEHLSKKILEFSPPKLTLWPAGFKKFESQKDSRIGQLEAELANKQREIDRLQDFARRFRAKASKARQAQNRLKTASHYEDEMQQLKDSLPLIVKRPAKFRLQLRERLPRLVIEVSKSTYGYSQDKPLFELDRCLVEAGKKIGVVGVNGVGKSTFLKTCAGELPLLKGDLKRAERVTTGFYSQHRLEELPLEMKAIDYLFEKNIDNTVSQVRGVAASLGLGENDLDKVIKVLSGGEKARVSLARILLSRPGLLLLDEPTNHLDIEACDALVRGLKSYDGSLLIVSHNRDFLDQLVDYVLEIRPGEAIMHHGNYTDWYHRYHQEQAKEQALSKKKKEVGRKSGEQKRLEAKKRQQLYNKSKEVNKKIIKAEKELDAAKAELEEINLHLADPQGPKDPGFSDRLKRHATLGPRIEKLEEEWLKLAQQKEEIESEA